MGEKRKSARKPIRLLVKLQCPDVTAFIERFSANVSRHGIFIRTRDPLDVSTRLDLEIQIAGGKPVIAGVALVRWLRHPGNPGGPPGMGVELTSMSDESQALLDRILAEADQPEDAKAMPAGAQPVEQTHLEESDLSDGSEAHDSDDPHLSALEEELDSPLPAGSDTTSPAPSTRAESPPSTADEPPDLADMLEPEEAAESPPPPPEDGLDETTEAVPPQTESIPLADVDGPDEPEEATETHPQSPEDVPGQSADAAPSDAEDVPMADMDGPGATDATATPNPQTEDDLSEMPVDLDVDLEGADEDDEELDVDLEDIDEGSTDAPSVVFLSPPEEVPEEGPVIGIDLGTTNSCVAFFKDGRPKVMSSREGYNTVPSIIAVSAKEKLLVGHPAKSQMLTNPQRTVYGAKRLVGRRYDSATVQQVTERFHYPICPDDAGRAAVRLAEHVVSLEEVQGLVLFECKAMAEEALGQRVHRAVVTVPAYYSDSQRQAVQESGRLAGLRVERILNEPTAAALAYGLNRELKKRVLVYDLGGGTFDATAMQIDGNVFEVLATGGDTFLGGVDFDNQIVDWLIEKFEESTDRPFTGDQVALSRVADAAERAKIALSEAVVHEVHIPYLMMDEDGVPVDLKCTITRDDVEALTEEMVERSLDVVRDVLLDAGLKPGDVEDVILVGGQSRMPLVRRKIGKLFGRDPHPGVHADEAVGLGAALLAGSVDRQSNIQLIDVLPMTIGVGLPGGRFKRIIERNTPLPTDKTYGISTSRKNQQEIVISIFQGEDQHISGNEYLGTLRLTGLPRGPKGSVRAAVTFNLGPECVLEVSAKDVATGQEVRSNLATRDTPEAIRKRLKIEGEDAAKVEAERAAELSARGGRFWKLFKRMVGAA